MVESKLSLIRSANVYDFYLTPRCVMTQSCALTFWTRQVTHRLVLLTPDSCSSCDRDKNMLYADVCTQHKLLYFKYSCTVTECFCGVHSAVWVTDFAITQFWLELRFVLSCCVSMLYCSKVIKKQILQLLTAVCPLNSKLGISVTFVCPHKSDWVCSAAVSQLYSVDILFLPPLLWSSFITYLRRLAFHSHR